MPPALAVPVGDPEPVEVAVELPATEVVALPVADTLTELVALLVAVVPTVVPSFVLELYELVGALLVLPATGSTLAELSVEPLPEDVGAILKLEEIGESAPLEEVEGATSAEPDGAL